MKKVLLLGGTGLVGGAINRAIKDDYKMVLTAGNHDIEGCLRLRTDEPERLLTVLDKDDPDIVISSFRGDFGEQFRFHEALAGWLAGKDKRLIFISTANVFDGDLSRPFTEEDTPVPDSEYGKFKRDCEAMLQKKLAERLIIFRLATVWAAECPRVSRLKEYSGTGKPLHSYRGSMVNITLADQIGGYVKYVLEHDLTGVFHVGTTDTVDYSEFEKMVCEALDIIPPEFESETFDKIVFQAVIPARKDIPERLRITVDEALNVLKRGK